MLRSKYETEYTISRIVDLWDYYEGCCADYYCVVSVDFGAVRHKKSPGLCLYERGKNAIS